MGKRLSNLIKKVKNLFEDQYYFSEKIEVVDDKKKLELSPEDHIKLKKKFNEISTSLSHTFQTVEDIFDIVFKKKGK